MKPIFVVSLVSLVAVASAQSGRVWPTILSDSTGEIGLFTSMTGGHARLLPTVNKKTGAETYVPGYESLFFDCFPENNRSLFTHMGEMLTTPQAYDVVHHKSNVESIALTGRTYAGQFCVGSIDIPGVAFQGATPSDPIVYEFQLTDDSSRKVGTTDYPFGKVKKEQKHWLPANFKFEIDGKVRNVVSTGHAKLFTITGEVQPQGARDIGIEDFSITIPSSDVGPYQEALKATLAGNPTPVTVDYSIGVLQVPICHLRAPMIVVGVDTENYLPFDGTPTLAHVILSNYSVQKHRYIGTVTIVK